VDKIFENPEIEEFFMPYIERSFPSQKDFGDNFVNGVKNWWFPSEEINQVCSEDVLWILDLEFGIKCGLKCQYCFRYDDNRDNNIKPSKQRNPLSLSEWHNLIDQACECGVKTVKLIGAGEFFEDSNFMSALRYLTDKGIKVVLFTSGYVLTDEEKIKRLHGMSPDEIIDYLYINGHSVFIKADSFKPAVMDKIVQTPDFTERRNIILAKLLEKGFTKETPTRLGFEVQVNVYTLPELRDLDKLKHYLNIYSDMVTSMPCGVYNIRKERGESIDITLDQKSKLYEDVYNQNIRFDISFNGLSPFIGGLRCTQLGYGLYINVVGDAYACPGCFDKIGNIRESKLKELWESHLQRKKYQNERYICPPRENADITPTRMYKTVQTKLRR